MSGLLEVRQHHDLEQLGTESGPSASSRPWSRRSSWSERTPGGCPVGPVYAHVHPHPPSYDEVPGGFVDFDSVAEGRFLNSVRDAPGGNRGKLTTWGQQKGTPGCDSPRRQLEAESAVKALAELGWGPPASVAVSWTVPGKRDNAANARSPGSSDRLLFGLGGSGVAGEGATWNEGLRLVRPPRAGSQGASPDEGAAMA